jgi:uncharacterized protein YndB with AHSA1/START domain
MASITVKHAATYDAPPEVVFGAITDVAREPQWQPQVLRTWQEPGGPVAVGTVIGRERMIMRRPTVQLSEVTALEANVTFQMREQQGSGDPFRVSYLLTPVGTGSTKLEFVMDIEGVPRMFASAVQRRLAGELAVQFGKLGELLAAGWRAGTS